MVKNKPIRCRIAACKEDLDDGKRWSFYLINDSDAALDSAVLKKIDYEWGDWGNSETTNVCITHLEPQAHVLIWRDDGSGAELRMDLTLLVLMSDCEALLQFKFPKLYRKTNLPLVDGLGKHGWQEVAEG